MNARSARGLPSRDPASFGFAPGLSLRYDAVPGGAMPAEAHCVFGDEVAIGTGKG